MNINTISQSKSDVILVFLVSLIVVGLIGRGCYSMKVEFNKNPVQQKI